MSTKRKVWRFSAGQFEQAEIVLQAEAQDSEDYRVWMYRNGWHERHSYPPQDANFASFAIYAYYSGEQHEWLFEFTYVDSYIMSILCPEGPDLLVLLRDYIFPLSRYNDSEKFALLAEEAHECLFDEQRGLQAAQRVKGHKAMMRWEQREKQRQQAALRKEKENATP